MNRVMNVWGACATAVGAAFVLLGIVIGMAFVNKIPSSHAATNAVAPTNLSDGSFASIQWTTNSAWHMPVFRLTTDDERQNFKLIDQFERNLFTIRVRGTNVFITTSNEVSLDQYWGPDDKYELRFWPAKEAK